MIRSQDFWVVNLGIKHWSPSYADQQTNLIPLWYPVMVILCRDNLKWGIKHWSSNLKEPTLDIEIMRSREEKKKMNNKKIHEQQTEKTEQNWK